MGSYLSVLSMKTDSMEEQYGRRLAFTGEEYGIQEKKDTVLQTMQFVGLDVGDMDNDSMQELVVAGYVPDGDDGVGQSVVKSKQAVVQLGFDQEKGCYKLLHGGIPYLLCQPAANQELYEGMRGSDVRQEPAAVACFASRGQGMEILCSWRAVVGTSVRVHLKRRCFDVSIMAARLIMLCRMKQMLQRTRRRRISISGRTITEI